VFVVESGTIELTRHRDDGTEELLTTVSDGGYFGELAPMLGLLRSATARAVGDAVVIGYSLRDFRDHVQPSSPGALLSESADAAEA
jgi:CRP-like cAMP-binding protein